MRHMKKILTVILFTFLIVLSVKSSCFAKTIRITIDPGHGGIDSGCPRKTNKGYVYEKNLNLQIALALKKELETYDGVEVFLTRNSDTAISLSSRIKVAVNNNSDLFVSVHNNAVGSSSKHVNGSCVIVSNGNYRSYLAKKEKKLGKLILKELASNPGTRNRGLLIRNYPGCRYPNGKTADYYALVRYATNYDMPGIIIEHAFIDSFSDYTAFLNKTSKLNKLGKADARAIAKYYKLKKKKKSTSSDKNKDSVSSNESNVSVSSNTVN